MDSAACPRVLIASENLDVRAQVQFILNSGYEIRTVGDGEAALAAARENQPDLVLADTILPLLDGIGLLRALRNDPRTCDIPVILLSAPANEDSRLDALEGEVTDYLIKPLSAPDLLARIVARLEIARLRRQLSELERRVRASAQVADAEFARKNNRLRRARNSLQRELSSRTEEVFQLNRELIADRQRLLSLKDELAGELKAMNQLHELSGRLLNHTGIERLLEEVLEASMAMLNADFGYVQLYDPGSRALKIVAQRGFKQDFLDYFDNVPEGTASCGAALEGRERVIVEDVLTDRIFAQHLPIVNAAGYRAVMSMPLIGRGGELLGIISTHFRQPHRPSECGLRLVDLYARGAVDMIEHKRAEDAWRASEERFRRYFELGLIGMAMTSPTKEILEVNDELCHILGYERSELLQKSWAEMTHPHDLAADLTQFNRVIAGEIDGYSLDKRWVRKDGAIIDSVMSARCMRRADGSVEYFVGLVLDTTERRSAEEKLRRSEAYLAEAQRLSRTASWAWNISTGEIYWSANLFRICGLDPDQFVPAYPAVLEYIHPEDRSRSQKAFEDAVREQREYELAYRVMWSDGTIRHVNNLARPVFNEAGDLIEYVGTTIDITERVQAEEALHRTQAELARVTRLTTMGELAASIAHEINQPLGAIVNNGNVAIRIATAENPSLDKLLDVLSDILADSTRISAIIARIRAAMKNSAPEKTSLQLKDVVADVLLLAQRELAKRRVQVRTELPEYLPLVSADRIQLQQVLLNLVMNGIDAMSDMDEARRILTIGGQRDDLAGQPAVLIEVRDFGDGFSPADHERLFDAFYTTKANGMGMGLRISRSIIEAHGGRLWATSNENQGASFYCALPIAN